MSEQNLNEQNVQQTAEDIDALRQVRLDKLAEMQQNGDDPFVITKFDVSASTAECRAMYEAAEAELPADLDEEAKKAAYEQINEKFEVTVFQVQFSFFRIYYCIFKFFNACILDDLIKKVGCFSYFRHMVTSLPSTDHDLTSEHGTAHRYCHGLLLTAESA